MRKQDYTPQHTAMLRELTMAAWGYPEVEEDEYAPNGVRDMEQLRDLPLGHARVRLESYRAPCTCPELLMEQGLHIQCPACALWHEAHPLTPSGSRVTRTTHELTMPGEAPLDMAKRLLAQMRDRYDTLRTRFRHHQVAIADLEARRDLLRMQQPGTIHERQEQSARPVSPWASPRGMDALINKLKSKRKSRKDARDKMRQLSRQIATMAARVEALRKEQCA